MLWSLSLGTGRHAQNLICTMWLLRAGYSIWTNTNYKNPLIASAVACLLGNVCYCLSYDLGAVWLLFLARLITGFGEPHTPHP